MASQICSALSNCINNGTWEIVAEQSVKLKTQFLLEGAGRVVDITFIPLSIATFTIVALATAVMSAERAADPIELEEKDDGVYEPKEGPKNVYVISLTASKIVASAALLNLIWGLSVHLPTILLNDTVLSFLKFKATQQNEWSSFLQSNWECSNNTLSNPTLARDNYIRGMGERVVYNAKLLQETISSSVLTSADFKLVTTVLSIIVIAAVALLSRSISSKPFTAILLVAGLFNLFFIGYSIVQLTSLRSNDVGEKMLAAWDACKKSV